MADDNTTMLAPDRFSPRGISTERVPPWFGDDLQEEATDPEGGAGVLTVIARGDLSGASYCQATPAGPFWHLPVVYRRGRYVVQ